MSALESDKRWTWLENGCVISPPHHCWNTVISQEKVRSFTVPLSNASLMRLTSLCDPGTLNMPSWWRPEWHTYTHLHHVTFSPRPGVCTHACTHRRASTHSYSVSKDLRHGSLLYHKNWLTVKVYETDAAFNHHGNLLPGALEGRDDEKERVRDKGRDWRGTEQERRNIQMKQMAANIGRKMCEDPRDREQFGKI